MVRVNNWPLNFLFQTFILKVMFFFDFSLFTRFKINN